MNGLEQSEKLYRTIGQPWLEKEFPDAISKICVGLSGEGSECYGYDDEISADHDVLPGFCLWIDDTTDRDLGEKLRASYAKLQPLLGYASNILHDDRRGVCTIHHFFQRFTGKEEGPKTLLEFFHTPEFYLSEATNGRIFRDDFGEMTRIRQRIAYFPEDVRLQKISAHAALAAQAGQYNYARCLAHGEKEAAKMALYEFVNHAISLIFALNFTYVPFYKWQFRMMRSLPILPDAATFLSSLLCPQPDKELPEKIDQFCLEIVRVLESQGLSSGNEPFLEYHAKKIKEQINDATIRSLHLMEL